MFWIMLFLVIFTVTAFGGPVKAYKALWPTIAFLLACGALVGFFFLIIALKFY